MEETLTMRPAPEVRSRGRSSDVRRKGPRKFVPNCISKPSIVSVLSGSAITAALLTRRSIDPVPPKAFDANLRTDARSARSRCSTATSASGAASRTSVAAVSPLPMLRHASTTSYPDLASSSAATLPKPVFAPVTTARLRREPSVADITTVWTAALSDRPALRAAAPALRESERASVPFLAAVVPARENMPKHPTEHRGCSSRAGASAASASASGARSPASPSIGCASGSVSAGGSKTN
mmetsp:Transcript_25777/g.84839  ORF Transcript_25777/g.84839 Transcript_25777/m.84839 type:complete len:239 (+) Transcript_25777:1270-1986(+)